MCRLIGRQEVVQVPKERVTTQRVLFLVLVGLTHRDGARPVPPLECSDFVTDVRFSLGTPSLSGIIHRLPSTKSRLPTTVVSPLGDCLLDLRIERPNLGSSVAVTIRHTLSLHNMNKVQIAGQCLSSRLLVPEAKC